MTLRSLKLRLRALLTPRRTERELDDELAFHVEHEVQKHIANGLSPAEARTRARARFGSMTVAADECRDERGTRWVDVIVRDVLYAFRTSRRAPLAALTIVTTLALGLALVAVVFMVLNVLIFRVDAVRDPHELYGIGRAPSSDDAGGPFTRAQYDALVRETGVFSDTYATIAEVDSRVDGRTFNGTLVTGNFFHMLGVRAALGRTLTPADDLRVGGNPVVVLSDYGWARYFARDPGILGRTLLLNGNSFQIVGVMPDGFRGLRVSPPDYWAPLSSVSQIRRLPPGNDDAVEVGVIGRLKPGMSRERAFAELLAWDARQGDGAPRQKPRAPLTLEPQRGTAPIDEAMWLVAPLFFSFGLILLIGCANVANLLLARAVARQREIGIRLATGASRVRIVSQLLTESLVLALVSAGLAFVMARVLIGAILHVVASTLPPDIGDIRLVVPPLDWRVAVFLVAGALVATMAFALVPALQATRIELVRAIRGEVVRDARPGRMRNVLIVIQVTASALLLICSAVFLRSALTSSTADPGFRTDDILAFDIANEPLRGVMLDAVRREPYVTAIAAAGPDVLGLRPAYAEGPRGKSPVAYKLVSPEYLDVFGIDLLRGRGFTRMERSPTTAVAIVSERTARDLWPDGNAVGEVLRLETALDGDMRPAADAPLVARTFVVVGIARNVPGFRFFPLKEAVVYVPTSAESPRTSIVMRVQGDPELARRALLDRLATIDPNVADVLTLRTVARMPFYFLRLGFWLTLGLGALALVLTLSGLFSVLSYLVEQRTREIGVRMALGATDRSIGLLVLRQLVRPVGVGLIIGGSLTLALGAVLLSISSEVASVVRLFDPIAYSASLLCIVAACACAALIPALRAGRIDPVATLRRD